MLVRLHSHPGTAQHELGAAIGMDRATLTELLRRLEARSLVRRERDPTDGRRYLVFLGDVDPDELRRSVQGAQSVNESALAGFSAGEANELRAALRRIGQNLTSA